MNFLTLLTATEQTKVHIRTHQKNEILFNEQDLCQMIGIVLEGEIVIASYSFSDKEVVFNVILKDQIFGSHLLFSSSPYFKGKVIAQKKAVVAYLEYADLCTILQNNQEAFLYFLKYNSDIAIHHRQEIELLSFHTAKDRLMYFLYLHQGQYTFKSITLLAKQLVLSREVLSKTIHELAEKKVLSLQKRTLKIN